MRSCRECDGNAYEFPEKLKKFEQALKLFLERVAADPNLLAAVLVRCLSEETIWRRDAIGLWLIEKDGATKRLRLRASFDLSGFSKPVQAILKGLKGYGMFVAENGMDWAISVAPEGNFRRARSANSRAA